MERKSDRIFGLVVILVALAYIASALQIQTSFISDPVGSKTFPVLVACAAILCGGVMIFSPDGEPDWPEARMGLSLLLSVALLVAYAYALKPLGFLLPTAVAGAVLSYQITPKAKSAAVIGVCLSIGMFLLFRYVLGLSLFALPRSLMG
jgi:putative tricarboxylic transport membrane protein